MTHYVDLVNEELNQVDLKLVQKVITEADSKIVDQVLKVWMSDQALLEARGKTTSQLAKVRLLALIQKLKKEKENFKKAKTPEEQNKILMNQLLILGQVSALTLVGKSGRGILSKFLLIS